jgi:hypothetical protein
MILRRGSSLGGVLIYSPAIKIGGQAKRSLDCAPFVPQGRWDDGAG